MEIQPGRVPTSTIGRKRARRVTKSGKSPDLLWWRISTSCPRLSTCSLRLHEFSDSFCTNQSFFVAGAAFLHVFALTAGSTGVRSVLCTKSLQKMKNLLCSGRETQSNCNERDGDTALCKGVAHKDTVVFKAL